MKEFIEYILKNIVDDADQISVSETNATNAIIFEIRAAQPDIGKIIGKKGAMISSIRHIIQAVASKHGVRITIHIIEDKA